MHPIRTVPNYQHRSHPAPPIHRKTMACHRPAKWRQPPTRQQRIDAQPVSTGNLTSGQAALLLDITRTSIKRLVSNGKIPNAIFDPHHNFHIRIPAPSLLTYFHRKNLEIPAKLREHVAAYRRLEHERAVASRKHHPDFADIELDDNSSSTAAPQKPLKSVTLDDVL